MSNARAQNIVGRSLGDKLILAAIVVVALIMMVPLFWVLGLSFKPNQELMADTNSVFHPPYTVKNYIDTFGNASVFRWLGTSLIVSIGLTIGILFLSSLAGYGFARLNFPWRNALFILVLFGLAVPEQAVIIARTFLGAWNDYWWPLISATKKEMFTLTVGIASTQQNFAQSEGLGFLMAQAVFAAAPILIVYLFFQRYIVTAVSGAAVR